MYTTFMLGSLNYHASRSPWGKFFEFLQRVTSVSYDEQPQVKIYLAPSSGLPGMAGTGVTLLG